MSHPKVCCLFVTALTIILLSDGCDGGIFGDIINTGKEVIVGTAKDTLNSIRTPEQLFEQLKNVVFGVPLETAISTVNLLCAAAVGSKELTSRLKVDLHKMNFELRTPCNKYSYPLLNSTDMWHSPEFDPSKKVIVYASGWLNVIGESKSIDGLSKAYNCRGDVNFVAVDTANFVDTLYTWSALNTEEIGANIAEGLVLLAQIVPIENIHLIGHSLGAHIMGAAARTFYYKTGKLIQRITGLDPARPCFNEGESLSGLMRGDAYFIDVIHSNPGILGIRDQVGDMDFYPGGLGPLPKGCYDISCAHGRAWQYYAETIYPGNELGFMGVRCSSLALLQQGKCPGQQIPMGYAVPTNLKGNYFLEINSESPFGKASTVDPDKSDCGLCQNANQTLSKA